jgi:hypothetical protein
MSMTLKTMVAVWFLTVPVVSWAADTVAQGAADVGADNFAFAPATGPQLKIDRRDGVISLCQQTDGQWACKLVADDRKAYEDRLAELEDQNARLSARVAELERKLQNLPVPTPDGADLEKFDQFLDLSDRMFRHFFNMVDDLKRDQKGKPI